MTAFNFNPVNRRQFLAGAAAAAGLAVVPAAAGQSSWREFYVAEYADTPDLTEDLRGAAVTAFNRAMDKHGFTVATDFNYVVEWSNKSDSYLHVWSAKLK